MIRRCEDRDFAEIWAFINAGAQAYKGVIPKDCWSKPYMSLEEGTRIRHAYVRTAREGKGIGAGLLSRRWLEVRC
jgi:hypothetical protein